jgi:hypothetical protein
MAALNFPAAPNIDDIFIANGKSYRWNGVSWINEGTVGPTGFTGSIGSIGFTGSQGAGFTGSQGLDGAIGFTGSAAPGSSGTKTMARFTAADNNPPAAGFATLDTRNSVLVLDFDDASIESAVFVGRVPEGAVLTSGILAKIEAMATTATTGNIRWRVEFERGTTDIDSDSFDTATEATMATSGTSGIATTTDITCTTIDSLVADDRFRVRISRVGNDGTNDTMSGDAELISVELRSA